MPIENSRNQENNASTTTELVSGFGARASVTAEHTMPTTNSVNVKFASKYRMVLSMRLPTIREVQRYCAALVKVSPSLVDEPFHDHR